MVWLAVAGCGGEDSPAADAAPPDAATPDAGDAVDAAADAGPMADAGCPCPGRQTCDDAGGCVEPDDCTDAIDCLAGRVCAEGICADACLGDGDCGDGLRCDPGAGACVPDDRCVGDGDCPSGACVDGECVMACVEGQCPGRQTCDPSSGACVEPDDCTDDIDCLDDRVCLDGLCATPCGEDAECPGAQGCVDGRCAEPAVCGGDADCTGDRLCLAGACADPCGRAGCPGALECDAGTGRCGEAAPCAGDDGCFAGRRCLEGACIEPCAEDADCPGVQRCDAGLCVDPSDCALDAACGPGRICEGGRCVDGCPAAPCAEGVCDEETGRCVVAGACVEAADCAGAQRCEDGRCVEPAACGGDADCLDERVCRDAICVTPCDRDADCPGSQRCGPGRCVEGPGCAIDDDCLGDRRCHPALAVCVDACPFGACPPGLVCEDGLCGEPADCLDDTQCVGARVCRLGRCVAGGCEVTAECADGTCVDFACADTAPGACDCPDGWACVDGGCEAPGPCGACPPGWPCGPDGRCVRCVGENDCPGGGVCAGDGTCVDPEMCIVAADCLPGRRCPFGQCEIDFDACDDDAIAGDAPDRAVDLPALALTGLWACDGRGDWFRVASADSAVRVTVRYDLGDPAPAVRLYAVGDPFEPVAVAALQPGEARVAAGPGDYLVEVRGEGASVAYGIEVEDGIACAADAFERPWRNDDRARARVIPAGTVEGTLCVGDEDWFRLDIARRLRVEIEGARAEVDGRQAPVEVQGPAVVRVTGAAGAQYALTVRPVADAGAACAAAEALAIGAAVDATVEAGGDDFAPACRGAGGAERVFRVAVPRAGRLRASLEGGDPRGGLLLYRDCAAEPVACSAAAGGLDAAVEAGDWFVVVDGPFVGDVRVELEAGSPLCDAPPALAPGETVIPLPIGPAEVGGACTDPELGAAVRRLRVAERAVARVSLEGGGPDALVSIRRDCADVAALACGVGPAPSVAPRLEPGDYVAIFQGEGDVTARLALEPVGDVPGFADGCDGGALAAGPGTDLPVEGDLTLAGDRVDLAPCGAPPGGPDAALRFRLDGRATVVAFIEQAAFGARLAVVDGGCGAVVECGSPMTGDVFADLPAGDYALVMEADGLAGGPFRVRLQVR